MGIDFAIVIIYLFIIVMVGLLSSGKVRTLKDFSLSTKTYGVFPLMATLSASFIGGGFSTGNAAKVAQHGLGSIVILFGFSISVILVGLFIVPNIKQFKHSISTGEIMKQVYGTPAQIFTGLFSMLVCAGILAAQVGAIGYMFQVFLGMNPMVGILIGCTVVIVYSTCGGMNAVVSTDVIQFCVLAAGIPILLYFSIHICGGINPIISQTPKEYYNIFNGYTPLGFFSMFLSLALGEALVPPYVQRLLMGNNLKATQKATVLSGILSVPFFIVSGLVGLAGAVYFTGTATDMNSIMQTMIKVAAPVGIRGIIIAGMLSIVMSSADSFLNSASVGLVCDVFVPLSKGRISNEKTLNLVRWVNLITGALAVVIATMIPNILDVLTFAYSFWSPIILIPLAAALLGYKGRPAAFYLSMIAGGLTMLIWSYVLKNPYGLDGTIVGVAVNLLTFTGVNRYFN